MIKMERVLVTPALASKWLSESKHRRPITQPRVNAYASDMVLGRWHENGETIKLSPSGTLLNGHHRCSAIVQVGASVWMWVAKNVDPSTLPTMDAGLPRRTSDWSTRENAAAGHAIAAKLVDWLSKSAKYRSAQVYDDVWDLIGDTNVQFAIRVSAKNKIANKASTRLAIALANRINIPIAQRAAEALRSMSAKRGDPEAAWMRAVTNSTIWGNRPENSVRFAVALVRDEKLSLIRPLPDDVMVSELNLEPIRNYVRTVLGSAREPQRSDAGDSVQ